MVSLFAVIVAEKVKDNQWYGTHPIPLRADSAGARILVWFLRPGA